MCGIAGFIDKKKQLSVSERKSLMSKMLDEMTHRGRDASGIYENEGTVIGHNRLAILDLSEAASQPMATRGGDLIISYNGEIYNHLDSRKDDLGYETSSDTETLLYAYKKNGKEAFETIRGMFAVSLYEPSSGRVTLSIDRFGIKPLYYLNNEDWFAWSSEAKAFRHLAGFSFSLNERRLFEYGIFRVIAGPETLFKGVDKMIPSQVVEYNINEDSITLSSYGDHEKAAGIAQDLESLLISSVSEHALSDVPVGLQLSGGVDSSLIAALATKSLRQKDVHSFSIGLEDPMWNEFAYSREVSDLLGTIHHEVTFDQDYFCKNYPIATYHLDEPIAYPNTVPLMMLSGVASGYVKVLLSGEGADELFGGYSRYGKLLHRDDDDAVLYSNGFCAKADVGRFFNVDESEIQYRQSIVSSARGKSIMQKLATYDLQTFLPSLLLRQDKVGMASTVENRFPFLDLRLADFALDLRDSQKVSNSESKIVLKKLASKYLPQNIIFRKKCGFGLPISEWLRDAKGLGRYLKFFTGPGIRRDYLNYAQITKCIDEHLNHEKDNSEIIWILLSLELWMRIFIDGESPGKIWNSLEK